MSASTPFMSEAQPKPARWGLPRTILTVLWPLVLVNMTVPSTPLTWFLVAGLAVYVIVAFVRSRWQIRLVAIGLSAAIVGICTAFGSWATIPAGIEKALIFVAFLSTIVPFYHGMNRHLYDTHIEGTGKGPGGHPVPLLFDIFVFIIDK